MSQSSIRGHPAATVVVPGDFPAKLGVGKFTRNNFCCLIILEALLEHLLCTAVDMTQLNT